MINARSLATMGIGFGVIAMTTLGVISDGVMPPQQQAITRGGGSSQNHSQTINTLHNNDMIMLVALAFMETRKWDH
jgi:hypothetical protein